MVTINALVSGFGVPDLVWIDIEGGAVAALAGASDLIVRGVTCSLIEVHDEAEAQTAGRLSGYRAEWTDHRHIVALPR